MSKENITKWCEALESGIYVQARDVLRDESGGKDHYAYCCLGVACDLYAKDTNQSFEKVVESHRDRDCKEDLPPEVSLWLGLEDNDSNPFLEDVKLSEYNDDLECSFEEIAEIIRNNLLKD